MEKHQIEQLANRGPIRVEVPPEIMFNLDDMIDVTKSVLDRLGCPGCHSGFDIRFDIIRRWTVNADKQLAPRFG